MTYIKHVNCLPSTETIEIDTSTETEKREHQQKYQRTIKEVTNNNSQSMYLATQSHLPWRAITLYVLAFRSWGSYSMKLLLISIIVITSVNLITYLLLQLYLPLLISSSWSSPYGFRSHAYEHCHWHTVSQRLQIRLFNSDNHWNISQIVWNTPPWWLQRKNNQDLAWPTQLRFICI